MSRIGGVISTLEVNQVWYVDQAHCRGVHEVITLHCKFTRVCFRDSFTVLHVTRGVHQLILLNAEIEIAVIELVRQLSLSLASDQPLVHSVKFLIRLARTYFQPICEIISGCRVARFVCEKLRLKNFDVEVASGVLDVV